MQVRIREYVQYMAKITTSKYLGSIQLIRDTLSWDIYREIGGTPTAFCGTLRFRSTPVENHWCTI